MSPGPAPAPKRSLRTAWFTAVMVFALDQLSKLVVVHLLDLRTVGALPVLPPWLSFRMAWNTGINFGLLSGGAETMRWVLVGVALAISGWVTWWIRRDRPGARVLVSAGLLIGGALGNVVDRLIYGAVADFLNMSCCGIENPYAFNLADVAIFAGAFGLILFAPERRADRKAGRAPGATVRREPRPPAPKPRDGPRDPR